MDENSIIYSLSLFSGCISVSCLSSLSSLSYSLSLKYISKIKKIWLFSKLTLLLIISLISCTNTVVSITTCFQLAAECTSVTFKYIKLLWLDLCLLTAEGRLPLRNDNKSPPSISSRMMNWGSLSRHTPKRPRMWSCLKLLISRASLRNSSFSWSEALLRRV